MQRLQHLRSGVLFLAVAMLVSVGCGQARQGKRGAGHDHDHDHADAGPNGGAIVEWGDHEYHAEFTVSHPKKETIIYIWDKDLKKPVAAKADKVTLTITNETPPLKIVLKPAPLPGEAEGTASKFVGTDDKLGVEKEFKGEISGEVNGKSYTGTFEEKGDHDHKDDKKKDEKK